MGGVTGVYFCVDHWLIVYLIRLHAFRCRSRFPIFRVPQIEKDCWSPLRFRCALWKMLPASYLGFSFFVMLLSFYLFIYLLSLSFVFLSFFGGCRYTLCQGSDTYLFSCQYKCRCFDHITSFYAYDATNAYHASSYYPCPVESFFSPLSILPQAPSSMPVPPLMSSALSAGRLYRSQAFVRELGSTKSRALVPLPELGICCILAGYEYRHSFACNVYRGLRDYLPTSSSGK
ncbi:hypothetical protein ZOSMA_84G00120 [Zostera marina]|uniref:Uncharacterized protein n=1 Tax=Zostera marina TaxID=29655 RepID=A0A0K9NNL6_ZOSMR|nr:hypothetical protein ZOSMA_84G00120 [Zostera marina]